VTKNLTDLYRLFETQMTAVAIHHQHLVKVLVDQIAVIECSMIAVCHLYHLMVRVLAEVLIQKSIGFAMIAQLRGILLSQSLPPPNPQQLNVQEASIFLEKQLLLLRSFFSSFTEHIYIYVFINLFFFPECPPQSEVICA
jgi:hypothetical protein